jgi:hypothetical protein
MMLFLLFNPHTASNYGSISLLLNKKIDFEYIKRSRNYMKFLALTVSQTLYSQKILFSYINGFRRFMKSSQKLRTVTVCILFPFQFFKGC